jgi:hypothetical protein
MKRIAGVLAAAVLLLGASGVLHAQDPDPPAPADESITLSAKIPPIVAISLVGGISFSDDAADWQGAFDGNDPLEGEGTLTVVHRGNVAYSVSFDVTEASAEVLFELGDDDGWRPLTADASGTLLEGESPGRAELDLSARITAWYDVAPETYTVTIKFTITAD